MTWTIALAGNPNSGKTTLFNQFTGNHQFVGNWPGVTVEKKEGTLRGNKEVRMVDLPGIYSLSPYTKEEVVARQFLASGPDAIINVVDATNLERNLYLTEQLMEFGVPVVIALNQMDVVNKRGYTVKSDQLSAQMGVPVVEVSALRGTGVKECAEAAVKAAQAKQIPVPVKYSPRLETYLQQVEDQLPADTPQALRRYYSVKLLERDEAAAAQLSSVPDVEGVLVKAEAEFGDNTEGIIANDRYQNITSFIGNVYQKAAAAATVSEKIDKVLTNRILALPIFIVIIGLVYWISVSTVGTLATDWANDGVFGDGWFLGPGQEQLDEAAGEYDTAQAFVDEYLAAAEELGVAGAADIMEAREAGEDVDDAAMDSFVTAAAAAGVEATYTPVDEETGEVMADEAITGDAALFEEYLAVEEPDPAAFGIWVPGIPVLIENGLTAIECADWLQALVLDGIVAGVGAVLGFVPQIMILFFLLAILEGCGYMARVAFILDRIFRRFGLSGKTFIPMLIGTGCGVPGIMASRTIESESSRRLTVMTTTFMPCSAKLPIIALFAGAIFAGSGLIATLAYFVGIASIIVSGIMLKKTRPFYGDTTPFVMELPEYRLPRFVDLLRSMWQRAWAFIKKAGTIILLSCILVWFLSSFGFVDGAFTMLTEDQMDMSILAAFGSAICIIFAPLGWGDWQAAASTVTGLIAKENLVGTFGILYGGGEGLWANLAAMYTLPAAASLMFFNLLCAPCFAAMGAIRREMASGKWFWAAVGYECGYAYAFALCVYQIGSAITGDVNPVGLVVAIAIIAFVLFMLFRPDPSKKKRGTRVTSVAAADAA
ncbi:MAG: ferrous iron transporter B [Coriobacteriia bacterium]|nr:ferrous iron transporter B [Coriobacteriia bacterium]